MTTKTKTPNDRLLRLFDEAVAEIRTVLLAETRQSGLDPDARPLIEAALDIEPESGPEAWAEFRRVRNHVGRRYIPAAPTAPR